MGGRHPKREREEHEAKKNERPKEKPLRFRVSDYIEILQFTYP